MVKVYYKKGRLLKEFKNKKEFVEHVKKIINIELKNEDSCLNKKRKFLYTYIDPNKETMILSYLHTTLGCGIHPHMENYCWIEFK
jgi:hypothetical protein